MRSNFQEIVMDETADVFVLFVNDDNLKNEDTLKRIAEVERAFSQTMAGLTDEGATKDRKVRFAKMNAQRNEFSHRSWPPDIALLPRVVLFPKHDKQWERPPEHVPWDRAYLLQMAGNPLHYQVALQEKGSFYPQIYVTASAELSKDFLVIKNHHKQAGQEKAAEAEKRKVKVAANEKAGAEAREKTRVEVAKAAEELAAYEERTMDAATAAVPIAEEIDFDEL